MNDTCSMDTGISVNGLTFSYGKAPFITDVSFTVAPGEIFGFLGPSGAGKSTLQKILTGSISCGYTGDVYVGGVNPAHADRSFYRRIGVDFEFPSMYAKLTARENLLFFGELYGIKRGRELESRAAELLEEAGLTQDADKKTAAYSKGMKSRLNFIKALIHNPDIIFLDEPTSGLDPANAASMKSYIAGLRRQGRTIILTTHNMYDAAELCDHVAFIVNGKITALDTPHNLIMKKGGSSVKYTWMENSLEQYAETPLSRLSGDTRLNRLIAENRITSIHSGEPTLNDIFVEITGRTLA